MDPTPPDAHLVPVRLSTSRPPPTSPLRDRIAQMQRLQAALRDREGQIPTNTTSTAATSTMSRFRNADEFLANGITKVKDLTSTATFSPAKATKNNIGEASGSSAAAKKASTSTFTSVLGASFPAAVKKRKAPIATPVPGVLSSGASINASAKASKKRKSLTDETCECPICYNPMGGKTTRTREEAVRITACGHVFGRTCLETHVKSGHASSNTCPMCRAELWKARRLVYGGARLRRVRPFDLQNFSGTFQAFNDSLAAFEGDFATLEGDMTTLRDRLVVFREAFGGTGYTDGAATTPVEGDAEADSLRDRFLNRLQEHRSRTVGPGESIAEDVETNRNVETQQGHQQESMRDRLRRRLQEQTVASVASGTTGGTSSARFFATIEDEGNTEIQELRNPLSAALRGNEESTSVAQGGGATTPAGGLQSPQSDADDEAEAIHDDVDFSIRIIEDFDFP